MSKDLESVYKKLVDFSLGVQRYNVFNNSTLEQFSAFIKEIHSYISNLDVDEREKQTILESLRIDLLEISIDIKSENPNMGFDFSVQRDQIAMKLRVFVNRIYDGPLK
jgi:hypothetical protein